MAILTKSVTVKRREPLHLCLCRPLFLDVVVSHLFRFDGSTFHSIRLLSGGTCVFSIKLTEEN